PPRACSSASTSRGNRGRPASRKAHTTAASVSGRHAASTITFIVSWSQICSHFGTSISSTEVRKNLDSSVPVVPESVSGRRRVFHKRLNLAPLQDLPAHHSRHRSQRSTCQYAGAGKWSVAGNLCVAEGKTPAGRGETWQLLFANERQKENGLRPVSQAVRSRGRLRFTS